MLNFELQLDERLPDRVFVSVLLGPEQGEADIDGVAIGLIGLSGEPLSSRLMLPIAGTLQQPVLTTVELRAGAAIPAGARVQAIAWCGPDQWEASIPADPGTQLAAHCRGREMLRPIPDEAVWFEPLDTHELVALEAVFPWLSPTPPAPPTIVEDDEDEQHTRDEELRAACEELGLDDDCASWLEDLLSEP